MATTREPAPLQPFDEGIEDRHGVLTWLGTGPAVIVVECTSTAFRYPTTTEALNQLRTINRTTCGADHCRLRDSHYIYESEQ